MPEESPDGKLAYNLLLSSPALVKEYFEDSVNQLLGVDHTYGLCVEDCPVLILGRLTGAGHYCPIYLLRVRQSRDHVQRCVPLLLDQGSSGGPANTHCG